MRVAHVTSSLDRRAGGVTAAVIGLAEAQARQGLDVTVLSTFCTGEETEPAAESLRAAGVKLTLVGPTVPRLMGWSPKTTSAVRTLLGGIDVLHAHAIWEDVQHQAMRQARRRRLPYVVSPHGMLASWSLGQRSLKKKLYLALRLRKNLDAASAIHFTTNEESRQAGPLKLRPPAIVEGLGLDLAEFAELPAVGSFRARYPELVDRPVVMFLSRLHPKKGLDLLVQAFAKVAAPEARLVLAGPADGDYETVVRDLVRQNGLADRVTFTGMLKGRDRVAALADADLFVLPSYQENFGIVVPEALAAGTPAVISDQVNFSEHLAGQTFADVVPCDVDAIATAITRWLADPAGRAAAGAAGRAWTLEHFDWSTVAANWVGHYERVVRRDG